MSLAGEALKRSLAGLEIAKITSGIANALSGLNNATALIVGNSIQNMLTGFNMDLLNTIRSPLVEWLHTVDFSPILQILRGINFDSDLLTKYKNLDEVYLSSMYAAKWFPYVGWIADMELVTEVINILNSSRGISKRCEKRLDNAILSYYTDAKMKQIKKDWHMSDLEPYIKKVLGQTIDAYLRKEYALVIPCLATMWEGLIKEKIEKNTSKPKEDFKKLVDENGYDEIFSDFYNNMIISTCYSKEDVIEGVPNRHGIAHGKYLKYPSRKAALNAILLTDFIIGLKSIEKTNEDEI